MMDNQSPYLLLSSSFWKVLETFRAHGVSSFPDGSEGKESACQCKRLGFSPWFEKIPLRRE